MKFYSDKLHKIFDTVEELEKAEIQLEEQAAKSASIKDKYKKSIDSIVKHMRIITELDKEDNLSDSDIDEIVSYLFDKVVPLFAKIRLW